MGRVARVGRALGAPPSVIHMTVPLEAPVAGTMGAPVSVTAPGRPGPAGATLDALIDIDMAVRTHNGNVPAHNVRV